MMSLWDALRMNMMISYQELVRTFLCSFNRDERLATSKRCHSSEQSPREARLLISARVASAFA
ncbi:hypothetical protein DN595_25115 [Enterobacter cloacae]|uniref:Uncharacterized protein n=1 Tax=Enterobacter cloacae TaxID=550 RepID=A0AB37VB08_ENTCL|nr:hypothetical protein DN595_25115 [Enterobacter cloacae]